MKISSVKVWYFSPTGGTAKIAKLLGAELCRSYGVEYRDVTVKGGSEAELCDGELGVFCVPVYGGRVPQPVYERLEHVKAAGNPAVLVAVYGNRAVDDALLELKNITGDRGFKTIAAGEFIAPHSLNTDFAAGRPDYDDIQEIKAFAEKICSKLDGISNFSDILEIQIPGNPEYRSYSGVPVKPSAGRRCVNCGACAANCPVGAIDKANPRLTDKNKCISCMRCVHICPHGARRVSKLIKAVVSIKLKKFCVGRKAPKFYM